MCLIFKLVTQVWKFDDEFFVALAYRPVYNVRNSKFSLQNRQNYARPVNDNCIDLMHYHAMYQLSNITLLDLTNIRGK